MNGAILAFLSIKLPVFFAASCTLAKPNFFFLPPWWEYLKGTVDSIGQCTPQFVFPQSIWPVAFAIIDMLLRLAGFVAVIGVIISGVTYMTTTGNPERAASARRRLYNSLIGLAIALVAVGFVKFLGSSLGG